MSQSSGESSARTALRADAKRSLDAILAAALEVFAKSGVDAPVREIAQRAGVGVATLYRRFPQRSDLIVAVFQRQVDACAEAAPQFAQQYSPGDALAHWLQRYADFIVTKRGLAAALHSGDPAYSALPAYFDAYLRPALQSLLDAAIDAGEVRADVDPDELLRAVGNLCLSAKQDRLDTARRMVSLLVDGMRYGAGK